MKDLFAPVAQFARIDMPDADVEFSPNFRMPQSNEHLFQQLCESTTWRHEEVVVYGRRHLQPRLTAWYGDPGKSYTYSGTVMTPLPWTDVLLDLKRELEERVETRFNSVLLNLYRNENDRMGFHSDNERSLGKEPTIASLSYGATRTLKFKHRKRSDLGIIKLLLADGSLLLMRGRTQENWAHGIDKETRPCGPRINLTFRTIES